MSGVYRYDPACGLYCDGPRMECRKDGDWVAFEDYEDVEKQRNLALEEVERLREVARQVHALTHKALVTDWRVGLTKETLTDIHKITKGMVE